MKMKRWFESILLEPFVGFDGKKEIAKSFKEKKYPSINFFDAIIDTVVTWRECFPLFHP